MSGAIRKVVCAACQHPGDKNMILCGARHLVFRWSFSTVRQVGQIHFGWCAALQTTRWRCRTQALSKQQPGVAL